VELRNKSKYEFVDISSEVYREYIWPDGKTVLINYPTHLAVSASGHRLLSADGFSHYIPYGWIHLRWIVKEGSPNFVK
jgi:hypothetical protein